MIKAMSNQRRMGAVLSYINIIAKNLVTFMYTPFLLRFVGQANYGLFQMTNSVMLSLSLLSMGFSSAYVRFYIMYKVQNNFRKIRSLNALYLLLFSFVSLIALLIGGGLVASTQRLFGNSLSQNQIVLAKYLMIIMVLDVAITFISSVFDSNITVNQRFTFQQGRQLLQTFLVPLICVPMVLLGLGVLAIEVTQIVVTITFLVLNAIYCIRKLGMQFDFKNIPIGLLKELIVFSFFIFLNQIVDLVNNNVPNFILGIVQGAKMVATFSIAVQIKNMFFQLSTSLSSVFVPKVNGIVNRKSGNDVLTALMIKVGRIQMTMLFFVLGGFIVVGQYFVNVWAGKGNHDAYLLVIIMVVPAIIPLSQNLGIEIQRAMNKHIFRSISYSLFAIVNIIVTFVGAKFFGLIGASSGYVVSVFLANGLLMNWYYESKMGLNMKKYWVNTLGTCVPFVVTTSVMTLLRVYIPINSIYDFFVFGVVYVISYTFVYIKWVATSYEKALIKDLIRI